MYDVLIKNALVVDGTGSQRKKQDLAISEDKIVAISDYILEPAKIVIDIDGSILAPGFIDAQNHSDDYWQLFDNPTLDSILLQGFTTISVGHCAESLAPVLPTTQFPRNRKWQTFVTNNYNWDSFLSLTKVLSAKKFGTNVSSLVGLDSIAITHQLDLNQVSAEQIDTVLYAYRLALESGACGISLLFPKKFTENYQHLLLEIARLTLEKQACISIHIADEKYDVDEIGGILLRLAKECKGLRVKFSHFRFSKQGNLEERRALLGVMEQVYGQGLEVCFDTYPYLYGLKPIEEYLPENLRKDLASKTISQKTIVDYLNSEPTVYSELVVVRSPGNLPVQSKLLSEIASGHEKTSVDTLADLMLNGDRDTWIFEKNITQEDLEILLNHPLCVIATDGAGFPSLFSRLTLLIHPRSFGTSVTLFKQVKNSSPLTLEKAVMLLTSKPAQFLGLRDRGQIKVGNIADLVVFKPELLTSSADMLRPFSACGGFEYVFISGEFAVKNDAIVSGQLGKFISAQI